MILSQTLNLFLQLIFVFSKIGLFNFGGGYAMLSLIQTEVVKHHHWLTNAEFTDIVAISQSTPGPIGINAATYVGYTAMLHLAQAEGFTEGFSETLAIIAAVVASLSIIWLPFILMIYISKYLMKHKDSKDVENIFSALRPTIVGLIAAAALLLMTPDNFGHPSDNPYLFGLSILIFLGSFFFTKVKNVNPILVMFLAGIVGLIFY